MFQWGRLRLRGIPIAARHLYCVYNRSSVSILFSSSFSVLISPGSFILVILIVVVVSEKQEKLPVYSYSLIYPRILVCPESLRILPKFKLHIIHKAH